MGSYNKIGDKSFCFKAKTEYLTAILLQISNLSFRDLCSLISKMNTMLSHS